MKKKKYLEPGVYSEYTVKAEDVLFALLPYIQDGKLKAEVEAALEGADEATLEDLRLEVAEHLNSLCAPYTWFGAHESDPACIGVWVDEDGLELDILTGELKVVSDLNQVPRRFSGLVLEVNDHGNRTLYEVDGKGNVKYLWGVV